jgi:hypothetical protein
MQNRFLAASWLAAAQPASHFVSIWLIRELVGFLVVLLRLTTHNPSILNASLIARLPNKKDQR